MTYYILKQFYPGADIWVAKLNDSDTEYSYNTIEEAETSLPEIQTLYPNNICKISTTV